MNRAVLTLLSTAVFGLGTPGETTAATNPALPMCPLVSNSGVGGETAGATARRAFWLTDADIPSGPRRDDAPPSDVHAHAPAGGGYLPPP